MWIQQAEHIEQTDTRAIVYARFNLMNSSIYIGETEHWNDRTAHHFAATFRHSERCGERCTRCNEHVRCKAHRCTTPRSWCVVPVAVLKHKYEAKRLEKKLIRQLKPRLNMEQKSPWRQGDTAHNYKFQEKVSKRAERNTLRSKRLTIGIRLRGGTTDTETNSNTNHWRKRITQPHRESVMPHFFIPGQPCVWLR